jgi:hypothetical protein
MKKYNCLACHKENGCGRSKTNKYCDNVCQGLFKWTNETIPRIERGECSDTKRALKKYLIEKQGENCVMCGMGNSWNNKPITLQLDHIDGNSDNNFPNNIRLLCPNCHSQTDTFGSKGNGNRYSKNTKRNTYLRKYKSLSA